jgi:hypothetical protein
MTKCTRSDTYAFARQKWFKKIQPNGTRSKKKNEGRFRVAQSLFRRAKNKELRLDHGVFQNESIEVKTKKHGGGRGKKAETNNP